MDSIGGFYEPPQSPTPPTGGFKPPTTATTTSGDGTSGDQAATAATAPAPAVNEGVNAATLDQELASVMKGIGSFWGKVRKQSVAAYSSAEKSLDTSFTSLTPLVTKARANITESLEHTKAELQRLSEVSQAQNTSGTSSSEQGVSMVVGADGTPVFVSDEPKVDRKGKGVDRSTPAEGEEGVDPTTVGPQPDDTAEEPTPAAITAAFFTKMQNQILTSNPTLTTNIQKSLTSVSTNLSSLPQSFEKLQHQIPSSLEKLQHQIPVFVEGQSKLAEGYLREGENWLNELGNEVGRLAKDVVRVVPPGPGSGKDGELKKKVSKADLVAVGRKEHLVYKLKGDYHALLIDPAKPPAEVDPSTVPASTTNSPRNSSEQPRYQEPDLRESYSKFLQAIEDKGGLEGEWFQSQVELESKDAVLSNTFKELVTVGKKISAEAFWSRYFFRKALIEEEEKKRKRILDVASTTEEDFAWDDEDDDEEEAPAPLPVAPISAPSEVVAPVPSTPAPATTLPISSSISSLHATSTTPKPSLPAPVITPTPTPVVAPPAPLVASSLPLVEPTAIVPPLPSNPISEPMNPLENSAEDSSEDSHKKQQSPRVSSDGASSYDVVGAMSGNPSEAESVGGDREDSGEDDGEADWGLEVENVESRRPSLVVEQPEVNKGKLETVSRKEVVVGTGVKEEDESSEDSDWE